MIVAAACKRGSVRRAVAPHVVVRLKLIERARGNGFVRDNVSIAVARRSCGGAPGGGDRRAIAVVALQFLQRFCVETHP